LFRDDFTDGFISNDPRWPLFEGAPNEVCEWSGRWGSGGRAPAGVPRPAGCASGLDVEVFLSGYINADIVQTEGLDFAATARRDILGGEGSIVLQGVYTDKYAGLNTAGNLVNAIGTDAFGINGVAANPQVRANVAFGYDRGSHSGRVTFRHIGEIEITNPDPLVQGRSEEFAFNTWDLNYTYNLPTEAPSRITFGVLNVGAAQTPIVANSLTTVTDGVYDTRGRVFNVMLSYTF
jgi:hypothetical protein